MPSYVDLHSHYLPALDDGAPDLVHTHAMVDAVAKLGFTHLVATPHQRQGLYFPARDAIDGAFAAVRAEVAPRHPELTLGLAAENFWDDVLHQRLQDGGLPSYEGGRAFLFEVPPSSMPPRIDSVLFQIRVAGRLPVMAHPERYAHVKDDPRRAEALGRTAALLVDLGSLDGAYGRAEMKTARFLIEEGLAHAVATDVHRPDDVRAVAAGMTWIRKRLGDDALARLLDENPRRILAGELP